MNILFQLLKQFELDIFSPNYIFFTLVYKNLIIILTVRIMSKNVSSERNSLASSHISEISNILYSEKSIGKLSTLRTNFQQSTQYTKKIIKEIDNIAKQILTRQLQIHKLSERKKEQLKIHDQLDKNIKRDEEQAMQYKYKIEKLDIRVSQYEAKSILQSNHLQRKKKYSNSLKDKIRQIQEKIQDSSSIDDQIQKMNKEIDDIQGKENKQEEELNQLYGILVKQGKKLREKEEQVHWKQKNRQKKEKQIFILEKNLISEEKNKENNPIISTNYKLKAIQQKQKTLKEHMLKNLNTLLTVDSDLSSMISKGTDFRQMISKDNQLLLKCRRGMFGIKKMKDIFEQQKLIQR